ncbi:MAG TPA: hypothetical protein VGG32_07045 [Thermoplasmata archaeon]|jgi:hypothetical protein
MAHKLAIGKGNTTVMTWPEFREFLRGKIIYHHQVNWVEEWTSLDREATEAQYFPYNGFLLRKADALGRYPYAGYGEKTLGTTVKRTGKGYWDSDYWKVTYNDGRNDYTGAKTGRKPKYYVTFHKGREDVLCNRCGREITGRDVQLGSYVNSGGQICGDCRNDEREKSLRRE